MRRAITAPDFDTFLSLIPSCERAASLLTHTVQLTDLPPGFL